MATINSLADILLDFKNVLTACQDNPEVLKIAQEMVASLENLVASITDLNARKNSTIGQKQQLTQQMDAAVKEGRELARRLRGAAKASLGTKNERLVQFKTAPLRDRKGRKTKSKGSKPPVASPPAAEPAPAAVPASQHETKAQA
jgi:DNA-directed RNA polymerase alpha subunit